MTPLDSRDDRFPLSDRILATVTPLADRFQAAGFRLYLVGGVVRDLAWTTRAGTAPPAFDIDLTTDARPADIKRLVSPQATEVWSQGERFGTIGALIDDQPVEITTHRAEAYDPASRKPVVSFGDRLEDDLSRRDFTINAAAIEVPSGRLHDPFDGLADLDSRVLRTPLSPETSFTDDPLRMLRAARFIPRFGLRADPALIGAASSLAERLAIVSVERVADELHRLLAVADAESGWWFLQRTGLVTHALSGFEEINEPSGQSSAVALAASLASAKGPGPDSRRQSVLVRRAGLLWPLGPSGADRELARLRASRADRSSTLAVIGGTNAVIELDGAIDATVLRRWAAAYGADRLADIVALLANLAEAEPSLVAEARVEELQRVIDEVVGNEDLADLTSPLSGADIMQLLGVEPGPIVGEASKHLAQVRIDQGPLSAEQASSRLLSWWEDRRSSGL